MPKTDFDYYYGVEAEQFTFVRVPEVLFTDKEHFGGLSKENTVPNTRSRNCSSAANVGSITVELLGRRRASRKSSGGV